jgi:hypothetical protein
MRSTYPRLILDLHLYAPTTMAPILAEFTSGTGAQGFFIGF